MILFLEPLLVIIFTYLIINKTNFSIYIKIIFSIISIILLDLIIKLAIGNGDDSEGIMVMNLFFYVSLICYFLVIIFFILGNSNKLLNSIYALISCLILIFYINHFYFFGMTIHHFPTGNIISSKKNNVFLGKLSVDKNKIKLGSDSVKILNGWLEEEIKTTDKGFFEEVKKTDSIFWVIQLETKFDENSNYNTKIYYKFDDSSYVDSYPISKTIFYKTSKKQTNQKIYFFKESNLKIKDSIKIFRK